MQPQQQRGHDRADRQRRGHEAGRRGVVDAGVRVTDQYEERQADDHDRGPQHLSPGDVLAREPVPEGQGPHDRRHQERLDDHQLAPVQRGTLRRVTHEQDQRAEQPLRHGDQSQQPGDAFDGVAAARQAELATLLQRRRKGEADCCEECQ